MILSLLNWNFVGLCWYYKVFDFGVWGVRNIVELRGIIVVEINGVFMLLFGGDYMMIVL